MVDLETYASDADHVKMAFVKFCDENGPTEICLTEHFQVDKKSLLLASNPKLFNIKPQVNPCGFLYC